MKVNIGQILETAADKDADRIGVIDRRGSRDTNPRESSYKHLHDTARRVAGALRGQGVEPGDFVALCAENSREFVAAWFGIAYAGATVVPFAPRSAIEEVAFGLERAECKVLLIDGPRRPLAAAAVNLDAKLMPLDEAERGTPLDKIALQDENSPALLLFTSGVTGMPKGVLISHRSLLIHTEHVRDTLGITKNDRVLAVAPMAHSYGCRAALLVPFSARACTVCIGPFDAEYSLWVMAKDKITFVPAVPTMYHRWAELREGVFTLLWRRFRLRKLRLALSAGAPLETRDARRAGWRLGVDVRQAYGMTEATFSTIDAPPYRRTLGTVGRPVKDVDVRIVEANDDAIPTPITAPGKDGEILVRGPNVMTGYFKDDAETLKLNDNWVRSGDIGFMDRDGRLTVVRRKKEVIISGGLNVYPAEVETHLRDHPSIAEVAVVGRKDKDLGEVAVAVIVPRTDSAGPWSDDQSMRSLARRSIEVLNLSQRRGPSIRLRSRRPNISRDLGLQIEWRSWGSEVAGATGSTILLLHAASLASGCWAPVVAALDRNLLRKTLIVAPDLRGHGLSSTPQPLPEAFSWIEFTEDLIAFADWLTKTHLGYPLQMTVGCSFSATFLVQAAARMPGLFGKLLLMDPLISSNRKNRPGLPQTFDGQQWANDTLKRTDSFLDERDLRIRLRGHSVHSVPHYRSWHADAWQAFVDSAVLVDHSGRCELRCRKEVEAEIYRGGESLDILTAARDVKDVCLIALAKHRRYGETFEDARRLAEALRGNLASCEVRAVPTGHFIPQEDPSLAARLIESTLES